MTEDKTTEFENTKWLADKLLNEPNADPDDDLRQLSRQFLRAIERETIARLDERRKVCDEILGKLTKPSKNIDTDGDFDDQIDTAFNRGYNYQLNEIKKIVTHLKSNP